MHDARSIRSRDEVAANDIPRLPFHRDETEPALVFFSDEIAARYALDDFRAFGHDGEALFCEDQKFVFHANLDVFHAGIHSQRDVRNQRPGCRRPHEEVGILFAFDFGFDVDGGILNVSISE